MSTNVTPVPPGHVAEAETMRMGEDDHGFGWIIFAGTVLGMVGTLNFIEGIAAVSNSHFFVANAHYVFSDLNTWGWIVLIIGAAQVLTSLGLLIQNQFARWLGVGFAAANGIAQLLFIPAYPFWSLTLFTLDILVMYGLIVHGGRQYSEA
jgi:hypothetical protein